MAASADDPHLAGLHVGEELQGPFQESGVLESDALEHGPRQVGARLGKVEADPGTSRPGRCGQDAPTQVRHEKQPPLIGRSCSRFLDEELQ